MPESSTQGKQGTRKVARDRSGSATEQTTDPPTGEHRAATLAGEQSSGLSHEHRRQLRSLQEFS